MTRSEGGRASCVGVPLPTSRRAEHNMGMPQATHFWTPDEVRALPADGRRYEVVAGELLVTPAPSFDHQQGIKLLMFALDAYVDQWSLGCAAISPADVTPSPARWCSRTCSSWASSPAAAPATGATSNGS